MTDELDAISPDFTPLLLISLIIVFSLLLLSLFLSRLARRSIECVDFRAFSDWHFGSLLVFFFLFRKCRIVLECAAWPSSSVFSSGNERRLYVPVWRERRGVVGRQKKITRCAADENLWRVVVVWKKPSSCLVCVVTVRRAVRSPERRRLSLSLYQG